MKAIFTNIILLISITIYSQEGTVVPLNTVYLDNASGTYAKDINNEFDPFVGNWYFINNNIKYTLTLQKMEHLLKTNSSNFYYYEDQMVCKYEALNLTTNNIISSTMNATDYEDFDITSLGGINNGDIDFLFLDKDKCDREISFKLYKMTYQPGTTTPYQLRLYNFGSDGWWEPNGCPYTSIDDIPFSLPLGSFTLTKEF